jgi:hypothetical protein
MVEHEGAQSVTWKRNKLVFMRNPANSEGMVEPRPEHQLKSNRCKTLISGRLSARPKARSLKSLPLRLRRIQLTEIVQSGAYQAVATKKCLLEPTPAL